MSDAKREQLAHEYKSALRDASDGAGEAALAHAYELGRLAASGGVGVVELATIHSDALHAVLGERAPACELDQFFVEALSPFEMTHRGFRDTIERLQAANRELEAFSYSVSHDLRAPLRMISAFTQALAQDLRYQLDDKSKDHLRRVLAAAARMSDLIDALLELSQISRETLGHHRVDLSAIAAAVIAEHKRRDVTRTIVARVQPGIEVEADGRLLRILFDNLIGNAVRFTAKLPTARVEIGSEYTRESGQELAYYVRDNGPGIDFTGPLRDYPRLGIGLATVLRIVERHGGQIWATGPPGQGTAFYFTLPPA